jgi:hypothetical protein
MIVKDLITYRARLLEHMKMIKTIVTKYHQKKVPVRTLTNALGELDYQLMRILIRVRQWNKKKISYTDTYKKKIRKYGKQLRDLVRNFASVAESTLKAGKWPYATVVEVKEIMKRSKGISLALSTLLRKVR